MHARTVCGGLTLRRAPFFRGPRCELKHLSGKHTHVYLTLWLLEVLQRVHLVLPISHLPH